MTVLHLSICNRLFTFSVGDRFPLRVMLSYVTVFFSSLEECMLFVLLSHMFLRYPHVGLYRCISKLITNYNVPSLTRAVLEWYKHLDETLDA